MTGFVIHAMILTGSALMVYNIIRYARFRVQVRNSGSWADREAALTGPLVLLSLFLVGYLAVELFGSPTLLVASILLGGSIFVFLILRLMQTITDRIRQNEQLQIDLQTAKRASEAKTVFLSNMSHDIRTPMNAIIGYTHLADREDVTLEEAKEYLRKIDGSSRHLLSLINDVLEMSRIERGKLELENGPADLAQLMEELRDLFETQMREKGVRFTVDSSQLSAPRVVCDRNRLNRVLLNLVSNAYKFTPAGGEVAVTLRQIDSGADGRGVYRFSVKDTGIGMTPEFAAKVFDAFERERTSTVSGIQGTGLGMAISKSIVDLMGGSIRVKTAPNQGTEFVVEVSFPPCDAACEELAEAAAKEPATDFEGMRLLLAEDIEINREIAVMLLNGSGFKVECAVNGQEAVNKIQLSEPGYFDAILMDIQMPVMDGYAAAAAIRAIPDPLLANIPIIALTGNAFSEDRQRALDVGMNGHVSKPIDPKQLVEALSEVLSR